MRTINFMNNTPAILSFSHNNRSSGLLAKPILVMKGMSTLAVAGILGEAGDLSGYAHGHALLRHTGLNLAEASSGKWKGQMSISKRGRPRLHHALFMATMALIMNDEAFKRQHEAYDPDGALPLKKAACSFSFEL